MKLLYFLILCLFSAGIIYSLVGMNRTMTVVWFDGDTSVARWAAFVSISAVVLLLLWRTVTEVYKLLWNEQNRREKPKTKNFDHLEMSKVSKVEETEILPYEQQSSHKANHNS